MRYQCALDGDERQESEAHPSIPGRIMHHQMPELNTWFDPQRIIVELGHCGDPVRRDHTGPE
ncbi:MAG: hypothetical protein ACREB5_12315, partial [Sphingomonadaceae bacterium]